MFKKIALALTFVTAFSVAGLSFTNTADAWRERGYSAGRPYMSYYYGTPRAYNYGYYAPYRGRTARITTARAWWHGRITTRTTVLVTITAARSIARSSVATCSQSVIKSRKAPSNRRRFFIALVSAERCRVLDRKSFCDKLVQSGQATRPGTPPAITSQWQTQPAGYAGTKSPPVEEDAIASQESHMFKRVLLAFTFVVALGAAGVGMSSKAMAYGCDYGGYGYRAAYYPPVYASYRSYGYGGPVAYPQSLLPRLVCAGIPGVLRRRSSPPPAPSPSP